MLPEALRVQHEQREVMASREQREEQRELEVRCKELEDRCDELDKTKAALLDDLSESKQQVCR